MNEIHLIPPVYPVNMPSKFIRDRNRQSDQNQHKQETSDNDEEEQSSESAVQHIDEIV